MTGSGGEPLGALPAGLGREEMAREVQRALAWLGCGARVGLAVSGGADSVTMAHLAALARPDLAAVVLHVRHGLHDDRADVRAVSAAAAALGLDCVELPVSVVPDRRTAVEAAARDARYAALERSAGERGLEAVLLGHTADDQAETVLLNLGRGTGLAGLAGMRARRRHGAVTLARPLLRLRRGDVRALAMAAAWPWVADPMNDDRRRRRTRVRSTLLPALEELSGGPGDAVALLTRLAELARDDVEVLEAITAERAAGDVAVWGPVRAVPVETLRGLPTAIARRLVRHMLAEVRGGSAGLSAGAVERALRLRAGQAVDVTGGVRATCGQGWLAVAPAEPPAIAPRPLPQAGGGCVPLPEIGLCVCVGATAGGARAPLLPPGARDPDSAHALLPLSCAASVRGWRPGDCLSRRGGEEPVTRLLAGAGVPRPVLGLVPVVVDGHDRPVWVAGAGAAAGTGAGSAPAPPEELRRVWIEADLR